MEKCILIARGCLQIAICYVPRQVNWFHVREALLHMLHIRSAVWVVIVPMRVASSVVLVDYIIDGM
ncbi:hypothetical protein H5410_010073 [Solanum commersonii]|uniref:Uncharacterized protein n=1 Tax=Solanum commersonii TaxID=4109 RepID=A0A9J6ALG2_SOLCO|nr:hypothetical protein H5410_010073 [Solanum commersonii]